MKPTRHIFHELSQGVGHLLWHLEFPLEDEVSLPGEKLIGFTWFDRLRNLRRDMISRIAQQPAQTPLSVAFLGSSIGAQAYRFVMDALKHELFQSGKLGIIDALDRSELFLKVARNGIYPKEALPQLDDGVLRYVRDGAENNTFEVTNEVRKNVNFLPAQSLQDWKPARIYDIVVATNILQYIPEAQLPAVTSKLFRHANAVCFNYPDDPKSDIVFANMKSEGLVPANNKFEPKDFFPNKYGEYLIAVRRNNGV